MVLFPANVQMALDGGIPGAGFPLGSPVLAWLRLPLQVPLIWWALVHTRRASLPHRHRAHHNGAGAKGRKGQGTKRRWAMAGR